MLLIRGVGVGVKMQCGADLLNFSENPEEVEPRQFPEVVHGPHPARHQRREQVGVLGHVLQTLGHSAIGII